ncbi:MAG: hypothetical protein NT075_29000 [Chloroflexi bacterium]|nr:hypothetical protein [Chloroflexota bacterium]
MHYLLYWGGDRDTEDGFNQGLLVTQPLFGRLPERLRIVAGGVVDAIASLMAWFSPNAVGSGHSLTVICYGAGW